MTATIEPRRLRPQGVLATAVGTRVDRAPFRSRLKQLSNEDIQKAVDDVRMVLGADFGWGGSVVTVLSRRRDQIDSILDEVGL